MLKEDPENTFILLEKAEEGDPDVGRESRALGSYFLFWCAVSSFCGIDMKIGNRSTDYIIHVVSTAPEYPPVSTMQQQQAEQMQVYWKVSVFAF